MQGLKNWTKGSARALALGCAVGMLLASIAAAFVSDPSAGFAVLITCAEIAVLAAVAGIAYLTVSRAADRLVDRAVETSDGKPGPLARAAATMKGDLDDSRAVIGVGVASAVLGVVLLLLIAWLATTFLEADPQLRSLLWRLGVVTVAGFIGGVLRKQPRQGRADKATGFLWLVIWLCSFYVTGLIWRDQLGFTEWDILWKPFVELVIDGNVRTAEAITKWLGL